MSERNVSVELIRDLAEYAESHNITKMLKRAATTDGPLLQFKDDEGKWRITVSGIEALAYRAREPFRQHRLLELAVCVEKHETETALRTRYGKKLAS